MHVGEDPAQFVDGDISKQEHDKPPSHTISPRKPTIRATIYSQPIMNSCNCSEKRDSSVFLEWLSAVLRAGFALSSRL